MTTMKKFVFENLNEFNLNENMAQAKAILKKQGLDEDNDVFRKLKEILTKDNRMGYIGKFAKWLFEDRETWEAVTEVYSMMMQYGGKIPQIDSFKTVEDLYDFMQGGEIDIKVNQTINQLPSKARQAATDELRQLLRLNINVIDHVKKFYAKKGGRFKNSRELYKETETYIKNVAEGFDFETIMNKIKKKNLKVEIIYGSEDILIARLEDYAASCEIGSRSWCISYSKNQWDNYVGLLTNQYFIFDFNKDMGDKRSMIGVTVNLDGSFKAAHYKDDTTCSEDYINKLYTEEDKRKEEESA